MSLVPTLGHQQSNTPASLVRYLSNGQDNNEFIEKHTVLTFVQVTSCKIRGTDGVHMDVSAERGVVNFGI